MISEFLLLAGMAGPQPCDARTTWEAWLTGEYGEQYAFTVMGPSKNVTEVWIDPNQGDWTMLGVAGDELCEIIFGTEWPEGRR